MLGFYMCGVLVPVFLISALFFGTGKEKAAEFISGFHDIPVEKRSKYDKKRMARDVRNQCLIWASIMALGAVGSYFRIQYAAAAAYIIWGILFFKEVHLDAKKAFEKYKLS